MIASHTSDELIEVVWQESTSTLHNTLVADHGVLPSILAAARAASIIPLMSDEQTPLIAGVLPDGDGVLRARWSI